VTIRVLPTLGTGPPCRTYPLLIRASSLLWKNVKIDVSSQ
jgi:hypothetical protein